MTISQELLRLAVIATLVQRNETRLGRTGIMKLMYFLQELKKVPLGYSFRLYTYGPYDSQVLEDLKVATDAETVTAEAFQWQGGMGYEIKLGKNADEFISRYADELKDFDADLDWVVREFGNRTASDLEVVSTIIYVDRSSGQKGEHLTADEIVSRVGDVKPHHTEQKIRAILTDLVEKQVLKAVS